MKKNVTITDVARLSGFSPKTVSRVLNNEAYVKPETRAKILKVVEELNYTPNYFAQHIKKRRVKNLLVSLRDDYGTFPGLWSGALLKNVLLEAETLGYNVLVTTSSRTETTQGQHLFNPSLLDGVMLFDADQEDPRVRDILKSRLPVVSFGRIEGTDIPYVSSDDYKGAYKVANYLLNQGCESIYFILGSDQNYSQRERIRGVQSACRDKRISLARIKIFPNYYGFEEVYALCNELLERQDIPEAFFISCDENAIGALKALDEHLLQVPNDVSVVGFDNIALSRFTKPTLTTVSQNNKRIAHSLLTLLLKRVEGEQVKSVVLPIELVIRESSEKVF